MFQDKFFTKAAEPEKECGCEHGKINPEIYEEGGLIEEQEEKLQVPYHPASNVCSSLDTVVPQAMANSQQKFNDRFRSDIAKIGMSVEQYVARKLHYRSVDELCFQEGTDVLGNRITKFAGEQIDAIGTAIWNHETNGDGIIIADATGTGKGRSVSGIIRYAILEKKVVPFFFTEKKHLINDIYRDLIDIGFEAGVPKKFRKTVVVEGSGEFTDEQILKIIIRDIKDKDDVRIEFSLPQDFNLEWIGRSLDETHPRYDEIEEIKAELIEAYRQHFMENGYERDVYEENPNYEQEVIEALRKGKTQVRPFVPNLIDIKDINGNILYEAITKEEASLIYKMKREGKKFVEDPEVDESQLILPAKFKLFALPYSQVGTVYYKFEGREKIKNKVRLLLKYAHNSVMALDECFAGESLIDGVKIKNIKCGDRVRSFNHLTNKVEYKEVRNIYINPVTEILKVTFSNGVIHYVTGNHPYFCTQYNEYLPIQKLFNSFVVSIMPNEYGSEKRMGKHTLQDLQKTNKNNYRSAKNSSSEKKSNLLEEVQKETCFGNINEERAETCRIQSLDWLGKNENEQPYAESENTSKSINNLEGNGALYKTKTPGRERKTNHAPKITCGGSRMENGSYRKDDAQTAKISTSLQNRCREPGINGSHRSGWRISQQQEGQKNRCKERQTANGIRVENIEIFKQGCGGEFERLCPEGVVYNIEVADNNNYFVENVLVHNCHNSSGTNQEELTNTGKIVFRMVKSAQMTTYVSATYAKRPDNIPLYALKTSIRESGLSDSEMIHTFIQGGNALQEAVSSELARNGQLLRREKTIQGKSEYIYESENSETGMNQIAKLDRVAHLYQMVLDFSQAVRSVISEYKKSLSAEEKAKIKPARGVNALAFQLFNFMLLGLKIRQTTTLAIENLSKGRKVVIAVASTMESALDNFSKTFLTNMETDCYKIGDTIKNDFSLYMAYLLNYTMRYNAIETKVDEEGNEEETRQLVYVLDASDELSTRIKDALYSQYKKLLTEILQFDTGIPIAPIDMIERNIKEAGFSISEITGRQRRVSFDNETTTGTIVKREIKKTDVVVREFNENETDCLVINQSGATGVSMHAIPNKKVTEVNQPITLEDGTVVENAPTSLENKKQVKKRAMVNTQMELDVNKEVQKLGRINRMAQVYTPEYYYSISAIPSEARLTSLMEKKLRSLSANVSSNQTQSSYLFTSDDFFSDAAVTPFNETMKDIGEGQTQVTTGLQIQDYTKRLYFYPYEKQKAFYNTFSEKLEREIKTLIAQGLYTGKMTHKDYAAETIVKFPFYIGDNNAKTSFGRHSFIEKCTVKLYKERNTEQKIGQIIVDGLRIKNSNNELGTEDLFFTTLSDYQKRAEQTLDRYEKEKKHEINKSIENEKSSIEKISENIMKAKEALSKFNELEKALEFEEALKKTEKEKEAATKEMTEAIGRGDMVKVTEMAQSLNPIITEITALKEKLKPYEETLQNKGEHKKFVKEIRNLEDDKERLTKRISQYESNLKEYQQTISQGKKYLSKIGAIMHLDVYDPIIRREEDEETNEERIVEYKPNRVYSAAVVLTGISFPFGSYNLTPGKFEIHVCGVSEKFTYNLYRLEKTEPQEVTEHLTVLSPEYKGKWNAIAGKQDNSYKETRYMIIGSLLKTFALGKGNDISGQIIKYNTIDNKVRIGIEVADNENDETKHGKSTYKILEERYGNAETALQRPVYYDGNPENVNKFIEQYIFWYLFGETYEKIDAGISPDEGSFQPSQFRTEFVFQISSEDRQMYLLVNISEEYEMNAELLSRNYNSGTKVKVEQRVTASEILLAAKVEIVSDSINAIDFLAFHHGKANNVSINVDNYIVAGKTKNFPEAARTNSRTVATLRINRGSQFKFFFPTNLVGLEEVINYGVGYTARLTMNYPEFTTLIEYLSKNRMKPTFATGSKYFERHKGDYVFEQFVDDVEIERTEPPTGEIEFAEGAEKEISAMIDDLLKTLYETE